MNSKKHFIIAIDGFSSCGKSTIAKALAKRLNILYVDTGAMYRVLALYFIRHNISLDNNSGIEKALSEIKIDFDHQDGQLTVFLNGEDVSHEIRNMQVSNMVSKVATIKAVRTALVHQQQILGAEKSVVMDGRDIGSVVFPEADVKIFMTADSKIRAERRYLELKNKNEEVSFDEILENVIARDQLDLNRAESPLIQTKDAIVLDNSSLSEHEQLDFVINILKEKKLF